MPARVLVHARDRQPGFARAFAVAVHDPNLPVDGLYLDHPGVIGIAPGLALLFAAHSSRLATQDTDGN